LYAAIYRTSGRLSKLQHAMTMHSLTSLSAEVWCSDSCYECSTPLNNWKGDAAGPRNDMDVVTER